MSVSKVAYNDKFNLSKIEMKYLNNNKKNRLRPRQIVMN